MMRIRFAAGNDKAAAVRSGLTELRALSPGAPRQEGNIRALPESVRGALRVARTGTTHRDPMFDFFKRKRPSRRRLARGGNVSRRGLARSREKLAGALGDVFARRKLDAATLEELETALISADVGVAATQHLLDDLSARWKAAGGEGDPKALLKRPLVGPPRARSNSRL